MDALAHRSPLRIAPLTPGAYRADIDGLRAVAILAVVLFHAGMPGLDGGFVGVDVFLVISGFLVGGIVQREVTGDRFRFGRFYLRRARRILPALIATTLLTFVLGLALLSPPEMTRFAGSALAALGGVANLWFLLTAGYFSPDAKFEPFLMTWSLGVEEQFYLALPPLLLLLHRWRRNMVVPAVAALTALSLLASVVLTPRMPPESFYLLPTRAWELGVGVLLAIVPVGRRLFGRTREMLGISGFVAILIAILCYDEHVRFPGYAALLPVSGAAALISAGGSAVNRRLLGSAPMVGIGLVSYSWYLWHWPLLAMARIAVGAAPPLWLTLSLTMVSLGTAILSWRFVERPFRTGKSQHSDVRQLVRYATAVILCAVPLALAVATGGLPQRLASAATETTRIIAEGPGDDCLVSESTDRPIARSPCVSGAAGRPQLALLGDSHAHTLGGALRARAEAHGWGFVEFTKPSCPPLLGGTRAMPHAPGHAERCRRFATEAIRAVARDPDVRTVILTGFWRVPFDPKAIAAGDRYLSAAADDTSEEALRTTLGVAIDLLAAHGKRVIVLGDAPGLRFDPARRAYVPFLPLRATLARLAGSDTDPRTAKTVDLWPFDGAGDRSVAQVAPGRSDVTYASIAGVLCDASGCRTGDGVRPYFIDPNHLSRPGADHALDRLKLPLFDRR